MPCVLLLSRAAHREGPNPQLSQRPGVNSPVWGNSHPTWVARSQEQPKLQGQFKHRECTRALLTCFFHKGGWKPGDLHSHHTPPPKQLHTLALAQPLPAEGVLGSSPCASCTSRFCEMLVLNLCVRISGFSKAGIPQCFIRMMHRSSSLLPRSREKDTE